MNHDGSRILTAWGRRLGVLLVTAGIALACGDTGGDGQGADPVVTPPGAQEEGAFTVDEHGGSFSGDGVTLTVPAGALVGPVTIRVTSDTGAVPGHVVEGRIYRFAPAGLTFALPIDVTLPATHAGARMFWTAQGTESVFAPLPTTFAAPGGALGHVTHFSSGFVGRVEGDDAGDGPLDGGAPDGAVLDASDAGTCIQPEVVDPHSLADVPTATSFPAGSFGCPMGAPFGQVPTARTLRFTTPVALTMWESHALSAKSAASQSQVRAGCRLGAPVVAMHPSYDCRTSRTVLAAGSYTFVACDTLGHFQADPLPVAPNANVSCATATTNLTAQAPVFDGTTLYFQALGSGKPREITVTSAEGMTAGRYRLRVQTTCDDATTNLLDTAGGGTGSGTLCGPPEQHTLPAIPYGSPYWVVLSDIDPGIRFEITVL